MTQKLLIPFKAIFTLNVRTTMIGYFQNPNEISLEKEFKEVADDIGNVDIGKIIKNQRFRSKNYNKYKSLFKYHQPLEVIPSNMTIDDYRDFNLWFKLESYEIEVIQIIDNKITFTDSDKKVQTIETSEELELIKL